MRKFLGPVLIGVGAFLLTTALLLLLWVPGQVKRTPLDVDSVTRLSGEAAYLSEPKGPVKAMSHTVVDAKASTGDVVVFDNFSCLVRDPDGNAPDCVGGEQEGSRLIKAGTDRFATDRRTAESVDAKKYAGADAVQHEGLVNKFPFDVRKKTYTFWDGLIGRAVDATYQGQESLNGLNVYRFNVKVENESAEIASGVQGVYSDDKTLWIDPVTGSIIKQAETQKRQLPTGDNALDLKLEFTPETVAKNVDSAKASGSQLRTLGAIPPIALVLGLLFLVGGLLVGRRPGPRQDTADRTAEPAPAA